ncbi:MAG: phosphatase PAP2 family protein [Firmicutes bacterium]|nr:phosphatase PAP2 family protein [Bacillota bacterium]
MMDLTLITWAQEFATPTLTAFFTAITSLGSLEFYMFSIPVIYWLIDKHFGFRFAMFFIFSAYINSGAKHIFTTERPPREMRLVEQEGYAFPSGHAQGSTTFWGFLALKLKKPLAWAVAVLMIILVSVSRIYLGVHWPIDILGGLAIGTILLAGYTLVAQVDLEKIPFKRWMLGSALGAILLYVLQPIGDGPMTAGFLLGTSMGYRLELRHVRFKEDATFVQNVIKLALGLVILFVLRIALKPLVGWMPSGISYVVRYACLGLWASLGAPFAFVRLNLYKKTAVTKTA